MPTPPPPIKRRGHLALVVDRQPATLPTHWPDADGREIQWQEWHTFKIFICPPPEPDPCENCGSLAEQAINSGHLMPLPGETVLRPAPTPKRPKRMIKVPAHPIAALTAFACPDCGHIEVIENPASVGPVAGTGPLPEG